MSWQILTYSNRRGQLGIEVVRTLAWSARVPEISPHTVRRSPHGAADRRRLKTTEFGPPLHFSKLVRVDRRRVSVRDKALAASCFIHAFAPDRDALLRFKGALRIVRRLPAFHADCMRLGDVFRHGHQF